LITWAILKQFLAEVISIVVNHKISKMFFYFTQEELNDCAIRFIELLLQESAASLFESKSVNITANYVKFLILTLALLILVNNLSEKLLILILAEVKNVWSAAIFTISSWQYFSTKRRGVVWFYIVIVRDDRIILLGRSCHTWERPCW
jgi:hypothetical protein